MEFESTNNQLVDSRNPDPRLQEREGEEAKRKEVLVDQEARGKRVHKAKARGDKTQVMNQENSPLPRLQSR